MNEDYLVYLMEASDVIEADFIISYLASFGVKAEKHYSGAGEYMHIFMGYSSEGAEIAVPKSQLEIAQIAIDEMEIEHKSRRDREIEE